MLDDDNRIMNKTKSSHSAIIKSCAPANEEMFYWKIQRRCLGWRGNKRGTENQ